MLILRQKIFMNYGITTEEISNYAAGNNMSKADAYKALQEIKKNSGVAMNAYKDLDKSNYKATVLQADKDSAGKLAQGIQGQSEGGKFIVRNDMGKNKLSASGQAIQAQQARAANANRALADKNKYANLKKQGQAFKQGQTSGFKQGQQSVGIMGGIKNTWNNMGTAGKVAAGAALAGGAALLIRNRKKRKDAEQQLAAERAKNNARY